MSDVGQATNYACDTCGKVEPGYERKPPEGWVRRTWRPGLLSPPVGKTPPDRHYCSAACRASVEKKVGEPRLHPESAGATSAVVLTPDGTVVSADRTTTFTTMSFKGCA